MHANAHLGLSTKWQLQMPDLNDNFIKRISQKDMFGFRNQTDMNTEK